MNTAVFPGSFDPFTIGHEEIVRRALPLFDCLVIAIGYNSTKKSMFELAVRINWIQEIFANEKKITVERFEGLAVDFCLKINAQYILRGLRTSVDFEFEKQIVQMNKAMQPEIETFLLLSSAANSHISSTIIRDVILNKGNVSAFVPKVVNDFIENKLK